MGYVQSRLAYGHFDPSVGFVTENRNSHRNHSVYTFNARAQKSFILGKASASAFLEVFNLLNTDDLRIFTLQPSRGSLQAKEERRFGRRFQLGLQIDF